MNSLIVQERTIESSYADTLMHGVTVGDDTVIRPASAHWYMVFSRHEGHIYPLVVGPLMRSGAVSWTSDAEILWIRFKLGTYMPHLPTLKLRDAETTLPEASGRKFWLNGSAWEYPNYGNADVFVQRLVREGLLVSDPVVSGALDGQPQRMSYRTIRHRFLHVTGQSQSRIRQLERVQQAMDLLRQGHSIADVAYQTGYADQPHLTRNIRQLMGVTPAQVAQLAP
jgi:hypothetical protein